MYIILFDIDGTLVLTGGAGMRAMHRACEDLVSGGDPMAGVAFAGRTDWSILDDILRNHGHTLDEALLEELRRRYVTHLEEEIRLPGRGVKDVMPGIRELLEALHARADVRGGLLTGNFGEGAGQGRVPAISAGGRGARSSSSNPGNSFRGARSAGAPPAATVPCPSPWRGPASTASTVSRPSASSSSATRRAMSSARWWPAPR